MRKIEKVICIVVCLVLSVEMTGFEAGAADATGTREDGVAEAAGQDTVAPYEETAEAEAGQEDPEEAVEDSTDTTEKVDGTEEVAGDATEEETADATEGAAAIATEEAVVPESDAASNATGGNLEAITNFTAKEDPAASGTIKLQWTSNASGNVSDSDVTRKVYVDGAEKKVAISVSSSTQTSTTCTATVTLSDPDADLKTHTIQIKETFNGQTVESEPVSVSLTPKKPAAVTNLTATPGHMTMILSWQQDDTATGYYVYRGTTKIYEGSAKGYTDELSKVGEYTYRVQAYRRNEANEETLGDPVTKVAKLTDDCASKVQPMNFSGRLRTTAPYFKKATSKKKAGTLKKGTAVKTLDCQNARFLCKLNNGKQVWISKDRMSFTKQYYTKKDYTEHVKTSFVNAKKYKSSTGYLVWLSLYTQRVNIYKGEKGNWKLIRTCVVATGLSRTFTPLGVFKIGQKTQGWKKLNYYVKPAVRVKGCGNIWFHSRLKRRTDSKVLQGSMGRPISHGCIRMYDADINFLYKQVPKNSTCVSY